MSCLYHLSYPWVKNKRIFSCGIPWRPHSLQYVVRYALTFPSDRDLAYQIWSHCCTHAFIRTMDNIHTTDSSAWDSITVCTSLLASSNEHQHLYLPMNQLRNNHRHTYDTTRQRNTLPLNIVGNSGIIPLSMNHSWHSQTTSTMINVSAHCAIDLAATDDWQGNGDDSAVLLNVDWLRDDFSSENIRIVIYHLFELKTQRIKTGGIHSVAQRTHSLTGSCVEANDGNMSRCRLRASDFFIRLVFGVEESTGQLSIVNNGDEPVVD
jgi:hypothetical protein